jgi:hypothetical protein
MTDLAGAVDSVHVLLGLAFGAVIVALAATSVAGLFGRGNRLLADRLVLAAIAVVAVAAASGLAVLVLVGPPSDALHFVYAAVALLGFPVVRYVARNAQPRRFSLFLGIAAVALLGVVARLWTTG